MLCVLQEIDHRPAEKDPASQLFEAVLQVLTRKKVVLGFAEKRVSQFDFCGTLFYILPARRKAAL